MHRTERDRITARKTVGALYRRAHKFDFGLCAYCGSVREALDHCPPLRVATSLDLDRYVKSGGLFLLIPSCTKCNLFLGSKRLFTYEDRLSYLYSRYQTLVIREKRLWCSEEIEELGYNLKQIVETRMAKIKILVDKLKGVENTICNLTDEQVS